MLKIMATRITAFGNIAVEEGSQSPSRMHTIDRPFTIGATFKSISSSVDWYARARALLPQLFILTGLSICKCPYHPLIARIDIQSIKNYVSYTMSWHTKHRKRSSIDTMSISNIAIAYITITTKYRMRSMILKSKSIYNNLQRQSLLS